MYRKTEALCVFLLGGTVYTLIEMLWRGYSHPTMTLAGGVCMLIVHVVNHLLGSRGGAVGFIAKCTVSAFYITFVEFIAGVILNLWLGLGVWDYSSMPGNILGQICPAYAAAWFAVSAAALKLSDLIDLFFNFLKKREKTAV